MLGVVIGPTTSKNKHSMAIFIFILMCICLYEIIFLLTNRYDLTITFHYYISNYSYYLCMFERFSKSSNNKYTQNTCDLYICAHAAWITQVYSWEIERCRFQCKYNRKYIPIANIVSLSTFINASKRKNQNFAGV